MLAWLLGIILIAGGENADLQQSTSGRVESTYGQKVDSTVKRILHIDRVLIIGNLVANDKNPVNMKDSFDSGINFLSIG